MWFVRINCLRARSGVPLTAIPSSRRGTDFGTFGTGECRTWDEVARYYEDLLGAHFVWVPAADYVLEIRLSLEGSVAKVAVDGAGMRK